MKAVADIRKASIFQETGHQYFLSTVAHAAFRFLQALPSKPLRLREDSDELSPAVLFSRVVFTSSLHSDIMLSI